MASFAVIALSLPGFQGSAGPIGAQLRQRMSGVSWHHGCPVGFGGLRLLRVTHWGFDGAVHRGRLVVNRDSAGAALRTMRETPTSPATATSRRPPAPHIWIARLAPGG